MLRTPRITFAGNFAGSGGLGVYARNLAAALRAASYSVEQIQEGTEGARQKTPAGADLAMRHGWDHDGANSFAHGNFTRNILHDKGRNTLVFGFAPTLLSDDRIDEINAHFSLVLCDSHWAAEAARAVGIVPRVISLPPPMWSRQGRPAVAPSTRPFTFLHVSNGDGFVKGTDIVIAAFTRAFGCDPQVRLILKLSGSGVDHEKSRRRTSVLVEAIAAPNIYLDTRRLDQSAMRSLYGLADCYVHVPRLESLGMPPLEASACGVPSILHRGGPGQQVSELVPHFVVKHHEIILSAGTYRDNRAAGAFEADTDGLANVLSTVARGETPVACRDTATELSFEEATREAVDSMLSSVGNTDAL